MTITDTSGIYCIYFNEVYGKYYIGCSSSIKTRVQKHLSMLKLGTHSNKYLLNAYNKYKSPIVEVIEECSIDQMYEREIYYIDLLDAYTYGYNNTTGGEGGGFGEGNSSAKYTKNQYIEVVKLLAHTDNTYTQISEYTKVSKEAIKKIASFNSHMYLKKELPSEYLILEAKFNNRDNSAKSKGIVYPALVSPTGKEYIIDNIHAFCREHNLQPQNLHKVLTGQRPHHKNWTIK